MNRNSGPKLWHGWKKSTSKEGPLQCKHIYIIMHLEDVWKLKRGEPSGLQEGQDLRQVDSGGKQLSGSLISPTRQKQTKSTGEEQNQQSKSQNSGAKVKPLKQKEWEQEDKVGRWGQKTWLIYTRGRGDNHTQVRRMRETTCGGKRTKGGSKRGDNIKGRDYQNKTGSGKKQNRFKPWKRWNDGDGRFQNSVWSTSAT